MLGNHDAIGAGAVGEPNTGRNILRSESIRPGPDQRKPLQVPRLRQFRRVQRADDYLCIGQAVLPVGSVTMVRIAEINDELVPAECPNTSWASFVIRKPNTVYQTCSVTLHAYTENGPRVFEAIFAQGTAAVSWMEVAAVGHTQAASTITAGTFGGQVVANASNQTPGTSLIRNTKLVSADTTPTVNGEINWTYK